MNIEDAIKCAIDGTAVLFLGAGFSADAFSREGNRLGTGADLSHMICQTLKVKESDNLTISAQRYLDEKSTGDFIALLKKWLVCDETMTHHDIVVSLPWTRIYTTNYDNVIELSTKKANLIREDITITNCRYNHSRNIKQAIIHINGFINTVTEKNFYEEFKIADETYCRDGLLDSSWNNLFEYDLKKSKAVIFVGYSLKYDQDIVKFISKNEISDKCVFVDIDDGDEDKEYKLSRFGKLEKIGTKGLAEKIVEIKKTHCPQKQSIELESFEKIEEKFFYTEKNYSVVDVSKLLVQGVLERKYINQEGYCIRRKETIKEIVDALKSNAVVIIQSKLGNGKSVLMELLAENLVDDYNVYILKSFDNYVEDFGKIQASSGDRDNVILIDDYVNFLRFVQEVGKDFPQNLRLVLSSRTSINENLCYNLVHMYGYSESGIYVVDCDKLRDSEIVELVELLDKNGLWGSYLKKNRSQKKRIISKNYNSNISRVFYLLLDSQVISKQIENAMNTLNEKEELEKFVFAQSMNLLCNLKFSYSDLKDFTNISDNMLYSYRMNKDICEILDARNGTFVLSSPIFAQYIVKQNKNRDKLKEELKEIFRKCATNSAWESKYKQQRRQLLSRANLQLIFMTGFKISEADERDMLDYFQSIKGLPYVDENPYYWLQYAITALNLKEFIIAKSFFDSAYADAKQMDEFDTYQLDTHYARFLLENEINNNQNNPNNAMDAFIEAHQKLVGGKAGRKAISYVLKRVGKYEEYYEHFAPIFSDAQKKMYKEKAFEVMNKFEQYFKTVEVGKIPVDIVMSYKDYRKLYVNTVYMLNLKETDIKYNAKALRNQQIKNVF